MAGFIRRFTEFPSTAELVAIEGVVVIDSPPAGSVEGQGTGFVCLVGEFADCTYAAVVAPTTGAVTEDLRAVEIFSSQDLLNKVGGFDSTIGQFGGDFGNGFAALRNKTFSRLAVVPVNLASTAGLRVWRKLPTNTSATDTTPVVIVQGARVEAGREFRDALDRMKLAAPVVFAATPAFVDGIDGDVTSAGAAATQTFTSAGSTFVTDGVAEGDALVVGVIGGAGALGANADTYRVVSVTDETNIVVEKQDGSNFDWTTGNNLPFRIHQGSVADSGPENQFSEQPGYSVLARPLTDGQGTGSSAADNSWTVGTLLTPLVVPPALGATTADPLSGLAAATGPTLTVDFDASIQAPNAPNDASLDVLYSSAFDSLLTEESPGREINFLVAARKSDLIRTNIRQHVLDASAQGVGRRAIISPELDIVKATALTTVTGDTAPGVGATRAERVYYSWPPCLNFVPEAVGTSLATADGLTTDDGILDDPYDITLASIRSNQAPERNPGESTATTRAAQAHVLGIARNVPTLGINQYKLLKQKGVAGLRIDRRVGAVIQSGITSSLISGETNIARRDMADFIEDSISDRLVELVKQPLTPDLIDTILTETTEFLDSLLSEENPSAQRINSFNVDGVSGNTPEQLKKGIFVVIVTVGLLASADVIVVQADISEGAISLTTLAAAA